MKNCILLLFLYTLFFSENLFSEPICISLFSTSKSKQLWQNSKSISFSAESNFTLIREKGTGGNWHGENWNAPEAGMTETGFITIFNKNNEPIKVPAIFRARGMSSLNVGELEFPKLKVTIDKSSRHLLIGTEFENIDSFKINTHVTNNENIKNPELARTPMGRLRSENSPLREHLAYEIARILNLLTPTTRLATIRYRDTSTETNSPPTAASFPPSSATSFTKRAMLLETDKSTKKRLEAEPLSVDELSLFKITPIDPVEGALFHLFHKLLGSNDVGLYIYENIKMPTERNRPLFNAEIYRFKDGSLRPFVYDLDLSTFVSGYDLLNKSLYKNDYFNLLGDEASITAHMLFQLRMRIPHRHILSAIERIKQKKDELYKVIETAFKNNNLDQLGYENAKLHLDNFFSKADWVMSVQVLSTENVNFYHDSKGTKSGLKDDPITGEISTLRVGTPIKIIGEENNMLKISIIDTAADINYNSNVEKGIPSHIGYVSKGIKLIDFLPDDQVGILDNRDMSY